MTSVGHLTKRGRIEVEEVERDSDISTRFAWEISNIFQWQCVLRCTDGEITGNSNLAGYKSNSKKSCTETI